MRHILRRFAPFVVLLSAAGLIVDPGTLPTFSTTFPAAAEARPGGGGGGGGGGPRGGGQFGGGGGGQHFNAGQGPRYSGGQPEPARPNIRPAPPAPGPRPVPPPPGPRPWGPPPPMGPGPWLWALPAAAVAVTVAGMTYYNYQNTCYIAQYQGDNLVYVPVVGACPPPQ